MRVIPTHKTLPNARAHRFKANRVQRTCSMRILLVEDDTQLADSLSDALTAQHYNVDVAKDGEVGWSRLCAFDYDLTLLDIALPHIDGIQLCQRLRSHGRRLPVLMLTACDTSYDKVVGLDAGADVYMVKPFDLQELLAQIRAMLRRGMTIHSSVLLWGQLRLNSTTYDVSYGSSPLRLTPKEFSILELLMCHGRRVLSRGFILESIWLATDAPGEDAVKAHVKSLRQKLKRAGAPGHIIETVHGMGYRLQTIN